MDGILLINKPIGWTSFEVVNKVRSIIKQSNLASGNKKRYPVGHSGTLDPLATGLLIVLIGSYTKRSLEFGKLDKTYEFTIKLGQTSTTGDEEGNKTTLSDFRPANAQIRQVLNGFKGQIEQIPPIFSAIKINGQPAYKLARKGQSVQLAPRTVHINSIKLVSYHYPLVEIEAYVSSGTYIRSLAEDIGTALKTGAYTVSLRRTSIGQFNVLSAANPQSLIVKDIVSQLKVLNLPEQIK
jgi:tRNA pseudouridine55 synthase